MVRVQACHFLRSYFVHFDDACEQRYQEKNPISCLLLFFFDTSEIGKETIESKTLSAMLNVLNHLRYNLFISSI